MSLKNPDVTCNRLVDTLWNIPQREKPFSTHKNETLTILLKQHIITICPHQQSIATFLSIHCHVSVNSLPCICHHYRSHFRYVIPWLSHYAPLLIMTSWNGIFSRYVIIIPYPQRRNIMFSWWYCQNSRNYNFSIK